jgi:CBS domain-containing protein
MPESGGFLENLAVLAMNKPVSGIRHFIYNRPGASAIEYAVCLGLVCACLIAGAVLFGSRLQSSFGTAVANLPTSHGARREADREGMSRPAVDPAPNSGHELESTLTTSLGLQVTAWIVLASLVVWWISFGRRSSAIHDDGTQRTIPKELQKRFVEKRQEILRILFNDIEGLAHGRMLVQHLMSHAITSAQPSDDLAEVVKRMQDRDIRHVLVCATDGSLVGVLSDRDVRSRTGSKVADAMSTNPWTVTAETSVDSAIVLMLTRRIGCLPVLRDGLVCGVVTTTDLLMALQCNLRLTEEIAEHLTSSQGGAPMIAGVAQATESPELVAGPR